MSKESLLRSAIADFSYAGLHSCLLTSSIILLLLYYCYYNLKSKDLSDRVMNGAMSKGFGSILWGTTAASDQHWRTFYYNLKIWLSKSTWCNSVVMLLVLCLG